MRISSSGALLIAALAVSGACSENSLVGPALSGLPSLAVSAAAAPTVWISEVHYDNAGTDVGEFVEVMGAAGTDLTGWQIVLYNGSGGAAYNTATLSGSIASSCGANGVVSVGYPSNGIQNGNPDGIALVDASGTVVEFISYGGTFTAVGGPADGRVSTATVVAEPSTTPVGQSLQRNEAGVWQAPALATRDTCNGGPPAGSDPPPPPGSELPVVHISELHYDNAGTDSGEAVEVIGPSGTSLAGWEVVLYNGNGGAPYNTATLSGTIANMCDGRGVVTVTYPANGVQNGNPDGVALVDGAGRLVEFLSYGGTFTGVGGAANGVLSTDIGVAESTSTPAGQSLQRGPQGWKAPAANTFGACNAAVVPPPPPPPTLTFSGRLSSDPPLPVGFADQLFASGGAAPYTWSSDTPALASVDQDGVVTALAAGNAIIRATSANGVTGSTLVRTAVGVSSMTADYDGNAEFGEPADGSAADDFIIRRPQFTSSYNSNRGTPNWVSYNLEATHFGSEDRCDCFTPDPLLPSSYDVLSTADYTGAGAFHGFGIDRGHLARSADRTAASLDNASTYYFSNIIPQAADNNQGPWAIFENHLGDRARAGAEVYIVTGVSGNAGTIKNEGKIVIPERVWKVALVMDRNRGLDDVDSANDFELIAVDMPNVAGIRNVEWTTYTTTVNAIEARSGYDLLALLPDHVEWQVESGLEGDAPAAVRLALLTSVLEGIAGAGELSANNASGLFAKLSAAEQQIRGGSANAARGQLNAFQNQVAALERSGRLSANRAESLTLFAQTIIDSL